MIDEEKKYDKLIGDLKKLPKVNASENFEADILRKINSSDRNKKESFWDKIFVPGNLVPAAAAIVSAIIIFFIVDINSTAIEDPLNLQPRLREDIIVVEEFNEKDKIPLRGSKRNIGESEPLKKEETRQIPKTTVIEDELILSEENSEINDDVMTENSNAESLNIRQNLTLGKAVNKIAKTEAVQELKKDNFNFMQIKLSPKEKQEIEQLKQRMQATERAKTD